MSVVDIFHSRSAFWTPDLILYYSQGAAEAFMNAINKMVAESEENELQRKAVEFWPGRVVINPVEQKQVASFYFCGRYFSLLSAYSRLCRTIHSMFYLRRPRLKCAGSF